MLQVLGHEPEPALLGQAGTRGYARGREIGGRCVAPQPIATSHLLVTEQSAEPEHLDSFYAEKLVR